VRRAAKIAAVAVALLIPALAGCNPPGDEQAQLATPQLPVEVHDTLLIAAGADRSGRPTTMNLICTKAHQLHLLERTRLPGPHDERKVPWAYRATMLVDKDLSRKLEVEAELIALGELDTVLTPPLSPEQLERLALIFGPAIPQGVSFAGVAESIVSVPGKTSGTDIQAFISKCPEAEDGG